MTQVYVDDKVVPVTVVEIPDNYVCQKRELDGKFDVRIGVGSKKRVSNAVKGQYKGLPVVPRFTWNVNLSKEEAKEVGDKFGVSELKVGDKVTVTSTSKSKGFGGVVKRWGFHGGPKTHGQSDRLRAPGAIGAGTDPGRVLKGRKMAGRLGAKTVTVKNRKVIEVGDTYVLIKGPISGPNKTLIKMTITKSL